MHLRFVCKFTALLLGLFATLAPSVSGADLVPGVQGHHSRTFENYPSSENQYPKGDSMGRLSTGNLGDKPINLSIVLKYDIASVSKTFNKALLKLMPVYTNPNPSNPDLEGVAKPSVEHFYVVEVFNSENSGEITYDDVTSDDLKRVGGVMTVSGDLNPQDPDLLTVEVTEALRAARQDGWKSLSFRVTETDSKGELLELPEKTMFGIQFEANPVLHVE